MTESEYQELLAHGSSIRPCPTCKGSKAVGQHCLCSTCHGSGEVCVIPDAKTPGLIQQLVEDLFGKIS